MEDMMSLWEEVLNGADETDREDIARLVAQEPPEYNLHGGEYLRQIDNILGGIAMGTAGSAGCLGVTGLCEMRAREAIDCARKALGSGFPESGKEELQERVEEAIGYLPLEEGQGLSREFGIERQVSKHSTSAPGPSDHRFFGL